MAKRMTRAEIEAAQERALANAARLRELAERGLADLERRRGGPVRPAGVSNADWLRQMAEQAQAELDARKQAKQ